MAYPLQPTALPPLCLSDSSAPQHLPRPLDEPAQGVRFYASALEPKEKVCVETKHLLYRPPLTDICAPDTGLDLGRSLRTAESCA